MPRTRTVCRHKQRAAIDKALIRHRDDHLPDIMAAH